MIDRVLALGLLGCISTGALGASVRIPSKTVVLTFDDSVQSQLDFVAPLLVEYGFGATFFVTHGWMPDGDRFLDWEEIARIHEMGFEIGNHSWTHIGFSSPKAAARLEGELALVENELKRVGVPKPVSFAWPGNGFGLESVAVLRKAGYRFARRGMQPEIPYGKSIPGPLYVPELHDPLLVPTSGDAYPQWTLDHFKTVVDRTEDGKAVVLQFHGVPDVVHPWVHTSPDKFKEFMDYLKENGFRAIALRDLEPYVDRELDRPADTNPVRFPDKPDSELDWPVEAVATRADLDRWLKAMLNDYGYSIEEAATVAALPKKDIEARVAALGDKIAPAPPPKPGEPIKVLPYPGGRHPRIGFLDGAFDPQRGTKVGIFLPWEGSGYVVLDLPEATFSNVGFLFLAHTHVPTLWEKNNVVIENVDWTRRPDGGLAYERALPNGLRFGAVVVPRVGAVDLELWLENGTDVPLSEMRNQICAMTKGAPEFDEQTNERKLFRPPVAAARAEAGNRWILFAFDRCGRAWGNPPCPCFHSDPYLPDAKPGERVSLKGRMWFYEGEEIEGEIAKAAKEFSVLEGK